MFNFLHINKDVGNPLEEIRLVYDTSRSRMHQILLHYSSHSVALAGCLKIMLFMCCHYAVRR